MTEQKHTPTPWEVQGKYIYATGTVDTFCGPVIGVIAVCEETQETDSEGRTWSAGGDALANAAFIVRAVNSHEALVKALKALSAAVFAPNDDRSPELKAALELTVAAILQAGGEHGA
ncbi:MAG TPA: hypothetical protein VNS34_10505 [Rhizobiaceae bacterium]|nr:hypothetical protein [Rhizobiaceae bacterium]